LLIFVINKDEVIEAVVLF